MFVSWRLRVGVIRVAAANNARLRLRGSLSEDDRAWSNIRPGPQRDGGFNGIVDRRRGGRLIDDKLTVR